MRTSLSTASCLALIAGLAICLPVHAGDDDFYADPTRPVDVSADGGRVMSLNLGPALQATRVSATQKSATIDGKVYHVGDRFGRSEIVEIQPYEVVLRTPAHAGATREWRMRMVPRLSKAQGDEPATGEIKIEKAEPPADGESQ